MRKIIALGIMLLFVITCIIPNVNSLISKENTQLYSNLDYNGSWKYPDNIYCKTAKPFSPINPEHQNYKIANENKDFSVTKTNSKIVKKTSNTLSNGKTFYVGGSGPNNYTKIQDAIDDASDGDTVFVYNGTYYENVKINKKNINLIGEDRNTTVIDGSGGEDVVEVSADWIRINAFTIKGGCEGIFSVYTPYVNITDNKITSISNRGIILLYSNYSTISKNIISTNKHGIILVHSANNDIFSNIINYHIGNAISVSLSETNNIYNNKIENNGIDGIILCDSIGGCILLNNTIKKCGGTGLYLYDVSNCLIFRNIIKNCGSKGISLSFSSCGNNISQNKISNNDNGGIFIGGLTGGYSTGNIISNNIISHNNKSGIRFLLTTQNNIIDGNTIFNNEEFGILIDYSIKNIITDNDVFSNNLGGMKLYYNSVKNNISWNNVYDNPGFGGISIIDASNNNQLYSNHIANNTFGINISNSRNNKITKNNFLNNNRNAIFFNGRNKWQFNFWDRARLFLYPIFGLKNLFGLITISWVQFDWHPAKEPYDIRV